MEFSFTEEQALLKNSLIHFARRELNADLILRDQLGEFIWEHWRKSSEMGLCGLCVPKEYGGAGADFITSLIGIEALSYGCRDTGLVHSLVTQNCCAVIMVLFGNAFLKEKYLADIASGKQIAAQALTEADAGSDVGSMRTRIERESDRYILNGTKQFISNGPIASLVIVFAKGADDQKQPITNISAIMVEKGMKGFFPGKPIDKMGLRTLLNSELCFEDCDVPLTHLIGREGQGLIIFNEVIEWERAMMAACHLGVMERVMDRCVAFSKKRYQFGKPIGEFQSIANKIAEMKVNVEMGRLMVLKVGWMKDQKKRTHLESAICKLVMSENLKRVCLDAIQIHGAYGYASEMEIERELRDSVAATIYSGTSEIQKNIIYSLINVRG